MSLNLNFDPHNESFSWDKALLFAHLSNLAYSGTDAIKKFLLEEFNGEVFCHEIIGKDHDGQVYLIKLQDGLIICYRGTQEPMDFMVDAKVRLKKFPYGKGMVHRGFLQQYEEVNDQLLDKLHELQSGNNPIWITGHSLGAATATLTAAELMSGNSGMAQYVKGIYTIGQPRTGDSLFAFQHSQITMKGRSFRFVNDNDIVTRVPLDIPPSFPYAHINQSLKFNKEGELEIGDQFIGKVFERLKEIFAEVKESMKEMWEKASDEMGFADHSSELYIKCIAEHRRRGTRIESED